MPKNIPRTGKRDRPKTSVRGKRYLCAKCRKRSPKPVKHPAPWYCPRCLTEIAAKEAARAKLIESQLAAVHDHGKTKTGHVDVKADKNAGFARA